MHISLSPATAARTWKKLNMRFGLEIFGESLDSELFHKFADAPFLISRHCHAHLKQKKTFREDKGRAP